MEDHLSRPSTPITHVSDTAYWVACYRAMESERSDAHFRDPFARRLAGERGEAIVKAMPRGRTMAWPMVARTVVIDEIVTRAVEREGVDVVLNLAAGLDARPWRLDLPPALRWVEVDLPAMISYKRGVLANERTACRLESVELDLANADERRRLFARVGAMGKRVLGLSEGLLIYLRPEDVAALASDLRAVPAFEQWLVDLASPGLLKMMSKGWGARVAAGNAPFQFAPAEGTAFFAPLGWAEAEYRSIWEEARRLDRVPAYAWIVNLMAALSPPKRRAEMARFSGVVLLQRK